jgi:uncharacterized protein with FMN-binding domain
MQRSEIQIRKWLFAVGVLAAFIAYSLIIRHQGSEAVVMPPSSKNKAASSPTSGSDTRTKSSGATPAASYKDGSYTGSVADAFYGNVQVQVSISGGKITDVQFLQYPNDSPNSQSINQQAMPFLRQEAISTQNAHVDIVTGATQTSEAFIQSLGAALAKAQA